MTGNEESQKYDRKSFLIHDFCLRENLRTYDPYDIWKTSQGIWVKNLFNTSRLLGALPALALTLYDQLINNNIRLGYKKQEYPIVRALAAQTLLSEYKRLNSGNLLEGAEIHLRWLEENASKGYSGACWGLGFRWSAFKNVVYDENTPHTTHTPYALEAFHLFTQITGNSKFVELIKSCFMYYEKDVCVMYEDDRMMAVSYGPFKDKTVTNASSYTLYAYSIFLDYFPEMREYILNKMQKLYRFIVANQMSDGSWFYSPDNNSFIDCFHSCIIVKNLIKTNINEKIEGIEAIINNGWKYISEQFFNSEYGLYKRFTKKNKLSLTKFDLYDNAEVLNLTNLIGDNKKAKELDAAIDCYFINSKNIYSVIDYFAIKRNKNTLRWAVMPYLYALSGIK
ncbi:MAG: hypothetical protein WCS03_02685 [Bacteroidota bacterium]